MTSRLGAAARIERECACGPVGAAGIQTRSCGRIRATFYNRDKSSVTLNLAALCYLHAWEHDQAITDGLARRDQLKALRLDYSIASLARIDDWLTDTRVSNPFSFDQLLADRGLQNTLHLLAFYAGEVLARALGCHPEWHDAAAEVIKSWIRKAA